MQELLDTETFYADVAPKALLTHLQAGCTDRHDLDLLALHNEMQRYHLEVEGIPNYISMTDDAQKQAGRSSLAISDKTLPLFASTAMFKTEQYPRTNDNWEDLSKKEKTWANWNTSYKRVHAKARVKAQATERSDKFGAANVAEKLLKNSEVWMNNGGGKVEMKAIEG